MVDWEAWGANLPMMMVLLVMPLTFGLAFLLAPYGPWATFIAFLAPDGVALAAMRLSRKLTELFADRINHIRCTPESRGGKYGWTYPGNTFIYRYKRDPKPLGYISNYVRPDGSGVGAYLYELSVSPILNRFTHPKYNGGGPIKTMRWLMRFPWPIQMAQNPGTVPYRGISVPVTHFASANLWEIMPRAEYFTDPKRWNQFRGKPNMVPFVEIDDLSHTPIYYVFDSSGMRAALEQARSSQDARRRIRAALVPEAPRCENGHPLIVEGLVGRCAECGKEYDMPGAIAPVVRTP